MNTPIILASKSPRRKEILQDLDFKIRVSHSNIDEIGDPRDLTLKERIISIARRKAHDVSLQIDRELSQGIIIASDTVISFNGEILGKPQSRKEAFAMLTKLSGNSHSVITATVIIDNYKNQCYEVASETEVTFKELKKECINKYLDQFDYLDKAGAYGIQNDGDRLIKNIQGDYFNVMGLSVNKVLTYFKTYYDMNISMDNLVKKHEYLIRILQRDGDQDE